MTAPAPPPAAPSARPPAAPLPDSADLLAQLVGFAVLPRQSNLALLDWVTALLAPAGARVTRVPHADGSRANLWITVGPDTPGGVVLSGHTDVVSAEGQAWASDPFALTERDGRLYGRGTADMKGFLACALRAMLAAARAPLARPLHLALSCDEEIGCAGVHDLIAWAAAQAPRPALVVVGEPTSLALAVGHKGKRALVARCHGQAGHSALAPLALNALHLGAAFIAALQRRQAQLAKGGARDPGYEVPCTTLHAGTMQGGTALNIVPATCEIAFEIRDVAGDDVGAILAGLAADAEAIAAPHRARFPGARIEIEQTNAYPGLDADPAAPALRWFADLAGQPVGGFKVAFGTEAGLFAAGLGVPTVVWGPGSMSQGHRPDEFVTRADVEGCDAALGRLVAALCDPAALPPV